MKFNKWLSATFASAIIVTSGIVSGGNALLRSNQNNYSLQQNFSSNNVMSGKEFVNAVNDASSKKIDYNLEMDVDLSDLTVSEKINLNNITLNGNGHKIYDRNLKGKNDFAIRNEANEKDLYLFESVNNATIKNLTFDNVIFPIYTLNKSHLFNVNFENTAYENMSFTIYAFQENFSEVGSQIDTATIGLFILRMNNSTLENVEIKNISFSNNKIENTVGTSAREKTVIVAPIGYIKERLVGTN